MFEQVFKNIDDVLWKEAGCTTELDYTEQASWLLFLKYLDTLEQEKALEAQLDGKKYTHILDKPYRWETWASPKGKDGKLDHNVAMTGDDLRDFVNLKLFPYLHGFKQKATGPNTIEYKIGEIFGEIKNRIQSGYNLREIIDQIDELRFGSQTEKHELSHLYEAKIKNMGNAGRNGGEYYTPRPLIRAMVQVVNPKIGERIYDGAVGSAGFLCESFEYLKASGKPFIPPDRFIDEYQSRNERLADLMRRLGICEEKGSGVDKVIQAAEAYQLPAPDFRVGSRRTTAVLFGHQDIEQMDRTDRIRACYQHCCLRYVMNEQMTNQSLRERFKLPESKVATVSQIIAAAMEAERIKVSDPSQTSTRYRSYVPFWA